MLSELSVCYSCGERARLEKKPAGAQRRLYEFAGAIHKEQKKLIFFKKKLTKSFTIFFVFLIVVRIFTVDKNMKLKNSVFLGNHSRKF